MLLKILLASIICYSLSFLFRNYYNTEIYLILSMIVIFICSIIIIIKIIKKVAGKININQDKIIFKGI